MSQLNNSKEALSVLKELLADIEKQEYKQLTQEEIALLNMSDEEIADSLLKYFDER